MKGICSLRFVMLLESFDASMLGEAEQVSQERISDDELIIITVRVIFFLAYF
jgi:hypothetical protein